MVYKTTPMFKINIVKLMKSSVTLKFKKYVIKF